MDPWAPNNLLKSVSKIRFVWRHKQPILWATVDFKPRQRRLLIHLPERNNKNLRQEENIYKPRISNKKIPDLKNVVAATLYTPKVETILVTGVTVQTVHKCCFCKSPVAINKEISSVKCGNCKKGN